MSKSTEPSYSATDTGELEPKKPGLLHTKKPLPQRWTLLLMQTLVEWGGGVCQNDPRKRLCYADFWGGILRAGEMMFEMIFFGGGGSWKACNSVWNSKIKFLNNGEFSSFGWSTISPG